MWRATGAAVAAGMMPAAALAAVVTFTWTNPTAYVDGQPLPPGDLVSLEVRCESFTPTGGQVAACQVPPATMPAPPGTGQVELGNVPPTGGTYVFQARVSVISGAWSAWTVPVSKVYAPIDPNPPAMFAAQGATAYELKLLGNGELRLGRNVGTVTAPTQCGELMLEPGYYVVPEAAVELERRPKSSVMVAHCEPA